MKSMPMQIKNKLRQMQNTAEKMNKLEQELQGMFDEYNIDPECFRACGNFEVDTEALTFISYAEGDIEENIADIEKVFLYYVNRS